MVERKPRGELAELQFSLQNLIEKGKRSDREMKSLKKEVFKKVCLGHKESWLYALYVSMGLTFHFGHCLLTAKAA